MFFMFDKSIRFHCELGITLIDEIEVYQNDRIQWINEKSLTNAHMWNGIQAFRENNQMKMKYKLLRWLIHNNAIFLYREYAA